MSLRPRAALAALFVGGFSAAVYHLTATFQYSYDGLCYALDTEFGPVTNLFHPNHLLYSFISWLLLRAVLWVGHPIRAIYLMQAMNAVVAGVAVGFFFAILASRFGWKRGFLGTIVLGFSHAFWKEAVDPGCYAWATLATCGLLALLLEPETFKPFGIGVAHGIAILFHQMLVLVAPAFIYRLGRRRSGHYVIGMMAVVLVAYGGLGVYFHGSSLSDALYWALGPAGPPPNTPVLSHYWWSLDLIPNAIALWQSLVHSIVAVAAGPLSGIDWLWQGLLMLLTIFAGVRSLPYFKKKSVLGNEVIALWIWVGVLSLFQFFFWTGTLHYRLLFLPALITLLLILGESYRDPRPWGALGFAMSLAIWVNFETVIGPQNHPQNSPNLMRAWWVSRSLQPGDAFLFSGGGDESISNVYVAYFSPHVQGRSLRGYLFAHPQGDFSELNALVKGVRRSGNQVYMESALWDEREAHELEALGGLQTGAVKIWLKQFHRRAENVGPGGYRIFKVS